MEWMEPLTFVITELKSLMVHYIGYFKKRTPFDEQK